MSKEIATIFGIAASGKDTLLAAMAVDTFYQRIVNTTTRTPRLGEIEGIAYDFISPEAHQAHLEAGNYLTNAQAHGRHYGVLMSSVERAWTEGRLPIGHFGVEDHKALWRQHDEGFLAVRSIALTIRSFDAWHARMSERLSDGLIDKQELFSRGRTARDETIFIHQNADRFVSVSTDTIVHTQASVDSYLKYGVDPVVDGESVQVFVDELDKFLGKNGEQA